jgi:hypothetical protein
VITELIIGYLYPGRPLANVAFKTYGYISMSQAIMFLQDFKLGHYMKIPPRSMFIVQVSPHRLNPDIDSSEENVSEFARFCSCSSSGRCWRRRCTSGRRGGCWRA